MSGAHIAYTPRPDATPEAELSALAAVYKFLVERKEAAPESRPDDAKERSWNDSSAKQSIPRG